MDNREARSFLSVHRPGEDPGDARIAEAKKQAAAEPELAQWWTEEQELDRAIGAKLAAVPVPSDLRARLTSRPIPVLGASRDWRRAALAAAAVAVALAVLFGSWRGTFKPAASLADYRDEMVSFISLKPTLGLETSDLTRINDFLAKSGAPSQLELPPPLRRLDPVGCRTLRFRGQDVALVCFRRESGNIAHLFVVNRAALRGLRAQPQFAAQGEWTTATWVKGDRAYLLTVQGDKSAAEKYIRDT